MKILGSFIHENKRLIVCSYEKPYLSVTNKIIIDEKVYDVIKHDIMTSISNNKIVALLLDTKIEFENNTEIRFI